MGAMATQIASLMIVYTTVFFRRRSKKTSKLRVTGLCAGNSSETGEFPAQMTSNSENASIWWRHDVKLLSAMTPPFWCTERRIACLCVAILQKSNGSKGNRLSRSILGLAVKYKSISCNRLYGYLEINGHKVLPCLCRCRPRKIHQHDDVLTWKRFPHYWHFLGQI